MRSRRPSVASRQFWLLACFHQQHILPEQSMEPKEEYPFRNQFRILRTPPPTKELRNYEKVILETPERINVITDEKERANTIRKWGNRQVRYIPKKLLKPPHHMERNSFDVNQVIQELIAEDSFVVRKDRRVRMCEKWIDRVRMSMDKMDKVLAQEGELNKDEWELLETWATYAKHSIDDLEDFTGRQVRRPFPFEDPFCD
ncbi:hypothetical protein BT69DRAFT_1317178 [Atractiella rhizophila]|nr:hypothetical protein BT69DRAFT_1317178 [Atractiella rhizophila]